MPEAVLGWVWPNPGGGGGCADASLARPSATAPMPMRQSDVLERKRRGIASFSFRGSHAGYSANGVPGLCARIFQDFRRVGVRERWKNRQVFVRIPDSGREERGKRS